MKEFFFRLMDMLIILSLALTSGSCFFIAAWMRAQRSFRLNGGHCMELCDAQARRPEI